MDPRTLANVANAQAEAAARGQAMFATVQALASQLVMEALRAAYARLPYGHAGAPPAQAVMAEACALAAQQLPMLLDELPKLTRAGCEHLTREK